MWCEKNSLHGLMNAMRTIVSASPASAARESLWFTSAVHAAATPPLNRPLIYKRVAGCDLKLSTELPPDGRGVTASASPPGDRRRNA